MSFVFNPIKNDQTTLFSSGGNSAAVTLNNSYPPPNDQTGVSDTTAPTTSVARSIYALANNALPRADVVSLSNISTSATALVSVGTTGQSLTLQGNTISVGTTGNTVNIAGTAYTLPSATTSLGISASANVQVGNSTSGLRLGTAVNPPGATGGFTAIGESGRDVFIQGIRNPLTISGALTDESTSISLTAFVAGNVNSTNPHFTFRVVSAFTITSSPVFYVKTMGTAGTITFDILVNGASIYSTRPVLAFVAGATPTQCTTRGGQVGNVAGTISGVGSYSVSQHDLVRFAIYSSSGITGNWTGLKCYINLS
jgi:hypothetical protein